MGLGRHKLVLLVLVLSVSVLLYLLLPSMRPEPEEAEAARAEPPDGTNVTVRTATLSGAWPTFYREAVPRGSLERLGPGGSRAVTAWTLLHLKNLGGPGTLQILSEHGYRAVAIRLTRIRRVPTSSAHVFREGPHWVSPPRHGGAGHTSAGHHQSVHERPLLRTAPPAAPRPPEGLRASCSCGDKELQTAAVPADPGPHPHRIRHRRHEPGQPITREPAAPAEPHAEPP
ncbi:protein ABHD14A-like [Bufo bufo]|uniref:protein ABHD14A-like n=1 Tax=Bufo bufo TaxID=8384 RepID=UPI001ABE1B96|nr:protein ABHD14A-like [Bufo bufo]